MSGIGNHLIVVINGGDVRVQDSSGYDRHVLAVNVDNLEDGTCPVCGHEVKPDPFLNYDLICNACEVNWSHDVDNLEISAAVAKKYKEDHKDENSK